MSKQVITSAFVLDCSMAMAWCFEDEISPYSEKILEQMITQQALVPAHWPLEIANTLLTAEKRKRVDHIKAAGFKAYLNNFLIEVDAYLLSKPINIICDLAKEADLSAYDAAYLELALRKNLPLATLDKALKAAAKDCGLEIYLA